MTKKFAIVLALFVISIVCCAGCIGPGDNEDPEIPDVPDVPDVPVTPVDPVDPVVPVEEYSVMFMLNYGDAGAYTAETVKAGETVSKPATPTRSGYTFKGWFTAAEGGVEYDFTQAVNADVTLYAQWKKKSSSSSGGHSHNWGTGSVTTPATCVAEGVKTYTCSCGQTKTEVISATGQHSYGDWNSGVRTCIVCTTATETCQHPTTQVSGADVVCTICTMTIGQLSTMVAEINGNYYGSFASAMDNAADDDTIKLLATVTGGEVTKKVVIDTNDNETSLKYDDGVLEIDDIKIVCSTASDLGTVMFGDEEVVFVVDGSDNYVSGSDGNLIVAYTKKDTTYTVYTDSGLQMALDAANENAGEYVVNLAVDITDDVTVEQKPNVKITIDGKDKKFNGAITVDGKSSRYDTAFLTIQNVNFASDSISAAAFVNLGKSGDTNTRYVHGVTVKDCTFSYSGTVDAVAIKSYTGGDWNLTVDGCTVNEGMHSMLQVTNVEKGLKITDCYVYSKNGINLNNCPSLEMSGCTFDTKGYAVRVGVNGGVNSDQKSFSIANSNLKSACEDGDAVIIFRSSATNSKLTLSNTPLTGATKISGATEDTIIIIDGFSVWNGVVPANMPKTLVVDGDTQIVHVKSAAAFAYLSTLSEKWAEFYTDGIGRAYTNYANRAGADYYYSGKWTVRLDADIDLNNHEIDPVLIKIGENTGPSHFDGNGHTIKNAVITTDSTTTNTAGLFDDSRCDFKNLKLDNIQVTGSNVGNSCVGILAGSCNTAIDGITITNSKAINGKYTGGVVGYGYTDVTNCELTNVEVKGGYKMGGIIGYICASNSNTGEVTGNTLNDCIVDGLGGVYAGGKTEYIIGKVVGNYNCDGTCNGNTITSMTTSATENIGQIEVGKSVTQ